MKRFALTLVSCIREEAGLFDEGRNDTMEPRPGKIGRPPGDADVAIRHGIVVQPRFPRVLHKQVKAAARQEGLSLSRWILEVCASKVGARIQAARCQQRRKKSA
jgi:hypothetical protein